MCNIFHLSLISTFNLNKKLAEETRRLNNCSHSKVSVFIVIFIFSINSWMNQKTNWQT
jgi:hypothetical protein